MPRALFCVYLICCELNEYVCTTVKVTNCDPIGPALAVIKYISGMFVSDLKISG